MPSVPRLVWFFFARGASMLSKNERVCLDLLLKGFCGEKRLVGVSSLYDAAGKPAGLDETGFLKTLKNLESEDYIEVIRTDRHGEPFLYLRRKKRGENYKKERVEKAKKVAVRFGLAILSALITFFAGRILYAIFK